MSVTKRFDNLDLSGILSAGNADLSNQITIRGGVPVAGKVLTCDDNGLATWETPSGSGGGMESHVFATTSGLGAYHSTSGLTTGQVLRATSASGAAFGQLDLANANAITGSLLLANIPATLTGKDADTLDTLHAASLLPAGDTVGQIQYLGASGFLGADANLFWNTALQQLTAKKLYIDSTATIAGWLTLGGVSSGRIILYETDYIPVYKTSITTQLQTADILYQLPSAQGGAATFLRNNGSGILSWVTGTGTTNPGGSDTQVQFNDGGAFGGDAGLTYNKTNGVLYATTVTATDVRATNVKATTVTGTTLSAATFSGTNVYATTVTATNLAFTNVYATTVTATDVSAANIKATTVTGTTLSAATLEAGRLLLSDAGSRPLSFTNASSPWIRVGGDTEADVLLRLTDLGPGAVWDTAWSRALEIKARDATAGLPYGPVSIFMSGQWWNGSASVWKTLELEEKIRVDGSIEFWMELPASIPIFRICGDGANAQFKTHDQPGSYMDFFANVGAGSDNYVKMARMIGTGWEFYENVTIASGKTVDGRDISADIDQPVRTVSNPTFNNLILTGSLGMADTYAINMNAKSAMYSNGTALIVGAGFSSLWLTIEGVQKQISVDVNGFVKAA